MERLLEALAAKNIRLQGCTDAEVKKVARSVGIDPVDYLDREVKVGPYTNKRNETNTFVSSSPFVVGRKANGKTATVQGLYLRVECIDQAIADLEAARELLKK